MSDTLRAITIKPPWSWAILNGKDVENRVWSRSYRGPIAIHAGKGWDRDGEVSQLVWRAWRESGHVGPMFGGHPVIPVGAVVAVVDLVDICGEAFADPAPITCGCGPWAARGQYHWRLANVRPLVEPVPCKGALGLWTLPDDVEAAVVAQLGERVDG